MRHLHLMILFIFICSKSMGQISVDTCSYAFIDEFIDSKIIVKSYKMTNDTQEDYVTWISEDPIDTMSCAQAIGLYFNKRIGDFSLSFLIYENLLNSSLTNRIGKTFMKQIKPNEAFEYLITKKNVDSNYYENRIFIATRKEIEDYLYSRIPEDCFSTIETLPLNDNN